MACPPPPPPPQPHHRAWHATLPALVLLAAAALAGCASAPPLVGGRSQAPARDDGERDGPGIPPPDLLRVPDATPRIEPLRTGGPNKPYEVLGQAYTPLSGDVPLVERGLASWYGRKFHGRRTASGEPYDMYAMSAAHKTMPLPSYARVRNPANGREVVVRVNDRGPFHSSRVIDLSYTAALKLGLLGGVAMVEVERITQEAIRTGAWRSPGRDAPAATADAQPAALPPAAPEAADPIAQIALQVAREPDAPAPATGASADAAPGFWLQFGAFSQRDGALGLHQQLVRQVGWLAPLLAVFKDQQLHRVQAGPYASRADARSAAARLRDALQRLPAIVERR